MFFSTIKLPVTEQDKEWTEDSLSWLIEQFGADSISLQVLTPTKEYFNHDFTGSEDDANYALNEICRIMNIPSTDIQLRFFSAPPPIEFAEGIISTPAEGLDESWNSPAGLYYQDKSGKHIIEIDTQELNNPIALISTMAHELAHIKLVLDSDLEENDEYLTDLTAIYFGFGVFIANSSFSFNQWRNSSSQGWHASRKGYLPEQIIAYAMALLSKDQSQEQWTSFLNKSTLKYLTQCLRFINKYPEKIGFRCS